MIPPVLPTYARAPLAFVEGEGAWLVEEERRAIPRPRRRHRGDRSSATRTRRWSRRWRRRRGSSGTPRTSTASRTRRRWRSGWSRRPSPTRSSSPTPAPRRSSARSRWRASTSTTRASPSASGSSPSRASFHGRSYGGDLGGGVGEDGQGLRPGAAGLRPSCPSATSPRSRAAIRPETAAVMIEPIQGEGGIRVLPPRGSAGAAGALRRARAPAHPRRDPVRHGADRAALPSRVGRGHARHHDDRQGDRRRLPARRLPRHRGGGGRDDHGHARRRPTAATRSPAPWAAR